MIKITKKSLAAFAAEHPELILAKEEQRQVIGGNKSYCGEHLSRPFIDTDDGINTMSLPMCGAYPMTYDSHQPIDYNRGNTPFNCSTNDDPPPSSGVIIPPKFSDGQGGSGVIGSGAHYHHAPDEKPGDYEYGRELDPANIIGSKYDSDASGAYIGSGQVSGAYTKQPYIIDWWNGSSGGGGEKWPSPPDPIPSNPPSPDNTKNDPTNPAPVLPDATLPGGDTPYDSEADERNRLIAKGIKITSQVTTAADIGNSIKTELLKFALKGTEKGPVLSTYLKISKTFSKTVAGIGTINAGVEYAREPTTGNFIQLTLTFMVAATGVFVGGPVVTACVVAYSIADLCGGVDKATDELGEYLDREFPNAFQ